MGKKMLIDAAHREETRVAIVSGNRVENFDFESEAKRPLRGNIYLAKVTRVEPSLQAAFIEYGGNRHGFLAFSEIHPDYYQIPVADREKLLAEEAAEEFDEDDDNYDEDDDSDADAASDESDDAYDIGAHAFEADDESGDGNDDASDDEAATPAIAAEAASTESISEDVSDDEDAIDDDGDLPETNIEEINDEDSAEEVTSSDDDDDIDSSDDDDEGDDQSDEDSEASSDDDETVTASGDDDEKKSDNRGRGRGRGRNGNRNGGRGSSRGRNGRSGDRRPSRRSRSRHYKIQEVIKRRQIMLVQVVKEERGNKGAALTTYLSLAGRYCVLMPNTARGGGISRKITNTSDRRRLKEAMNEMDVATGMGLIVRTAGANRTKVEIKRDFDYLLRLWENIRDLTLKSSAPCLIYEEGDLIKRSIRDQYSKDIDEIIVDGDKAYKEAKDFMRMLMPSHAKNVKRYKDSEPLLQRHGVQSELDALLEPTVTLKSGGYIVINPTEALVSIDVNSGKSTKEHNIEATAVSTNLEAAEEIARQLRLRDMAGLVVIDFIDMDEPRNNRAVERKLKDSLKQDRARIQVGRISSFGLLEMSRQRMRSGVLEGSTDTCPHCQGTGMIRSTESAALQVLRAVEAEALKGRAKALDVNVPMDIAVFILNQKRTTLLDIERRGRVSVYMVADASLISPDYSIKRTDDRTPDVSMDTDALSMESAFDDEEDAALDAKAEAAARSEEEADASANTENSSGEDADGDGEDKPKRRRRRRRGRKSESGSAENNAAEDGDTSEAAATEASGSEDGDGETPELDEDGKPRKRRRRGRRGGRRHRRTADADDEGNSEGTNGDVETTAKASDSDVDTNNSTSDGDEEAPVLVAYSTSASEPMVVDQSQTPAESTTSPASETDNEAEQAVADTAAASAASTKASVEVETSETPAEPTKRGWWQRRLSS
ncbi:Cytoplasmic axial filament protein CafA and Ribonuclease G [Candidatus Phaeomarinobacter ectocarpi]|uniref:Ribonuclease E n=1 Tax=Candidatus Phaeomarinibacter ectocarpi TaxID=1458461 RepID=X5MN19_9HYPH|nr:ribonuclease E/G [Candidatus Phaeomarinobacter ectocarpi]CDO60915.1 Cytoplasmic axial filament protein CafA and Ribonuclease G [Candidatus Phaeomarinobacter ectocarpi]